MEETLIRPVPDLLLFLVMFLTIYLAGYFVVFRRWSPLRRPEAASCLISLFHGTPAVVIAVRAILGDPHRGFAAANTLAQNLVMDYSAAYFLADLLHYSIFYPGDLLFIAHHLATLFAYFICRCVARHGAFVILVLLVLAEVTSLCQNVWTLAGARRGEDAFAASVYRLLSPSFYAFYSVVRGLAGPLFAYQMGVKFFGGAVDGVIPRWVWGSWFLLTVVFIPLSLTWVANLWVVLYRERCAGEHDQKLD